MKRCYECMNFDMIDAINFEGICNITKESNDGLEKRECDFFKRKSYLFDAE